MGFYEAHSDPERDRQGLYNQLLEDALIKFGWKFEPLAQPEELRLFSAEGGLTNWIVIGFNFETQMALVVGPGGKPRLVTDYAIAKLLEAKRKENLDTFLQDIPDVDREQIATLKEENKKLTDALEMLRTRVRRSIIGGAAITAASVAIYIGVMLLLGGNGNPEKPKTDDTKGLVAKKEPPAPHDHGIVGRADGLLSGSMKPQKTEVIVAAEERNMKLLDGITVKELKKYGVHYEKSIGMDVLSVDVLKGGAFSNRFYHPTVKRNGDALVITSRDLLSRDVTVTVRPNGTASLQQLSTYPANGQLRKNDRVKYTYKKEVTPANAAKIVLKNTDWKDLETAYGIRIGNYSMNFGEGGEIECPILFIPDKLRRGALLDVSFYLNECPYPITIAKNVQDPSLQIHQNYYGSNRTITIRPTGETSLLNEYEYPRKKEPLIERPHWLDQQNGDGDFFDRDQDIIPAINR